MKITGYGSITPSSTVKKSGGVSRIGNFANILATSETSETVSSVPTGDVAVTDLSNLLALQEISEEDIRRRKLAQQGKGIIDVLEGLRRQLLVGTLPPRLLHDLRRQIELRKQLVNDPTLTAIVEDIELRAAVELAKLEAALHPGDR
ncbi:MAG: flagellar assembly protein FliX [Pseudomonadota bacterium]|nr:flagellar assembly protein FliX [Pseudomonadota bacterium]